MREGGYNYKGVAWVTEQYCDLIRVVPLALHEALHVTKLHRSTHTYTLFTMKTFYGLDRCLSFNIALGLCNIVQKKGWVVGAWSHLYHFGNFL